MLMTLVRQALELKLNFITADRSDLQRVAFKLVFPLDGFAHRLRACLCELLQSDNVAFYGELAAGRSDSLISSDDLLGALLGRVLLIPALAIDAGAHERHVLAVNDEHAFDYCVSLLAAGIGRRDVAISAVQLRAFSRD